MSLLLDVGNTRIKWARADTGVLQDLGAVAHQGEPARALDDCPIMDPDAVWICSVLDPAAEAELLRACGVRWPCPVQVTRSQARWQGLRNGYAEPKRLGADRWIAMLGAWAASPGACVIADAGTALTVDVVDAAGLHQGGIIAAGMQTSRRAVLGATRFRALEAGVPAHAGLGRDTEACVDQGVLLSCLGAIEHIAAGADPDAAFYLTGGDAELLLPHLDARWSYQPHLVLQGLMHYAGI